MQTRTFGMEDEQAVIALWREAFGYTTPHNDPALTIQLKLQTDPELFFVAVDGQRVVGTVMAGYDGHRGWIYSLAVEKESRRQGIATALVRHVESELCKRGCPKINLQILSANSDLVAFYQKMGYAVEPRISMGKVI